VGSYEDIAATRSRERITLILSAATFAIFFQAFMVAPILPHLATVFAVPIERLGLIVPAYLLPYGLTTLVYGILSDRIGRRRLILGSLATFTVLTAATASASSAAQLLMWRTLTGLGASAVVPLGLALIGQLFPYQQRGRPLGWLFGAMAGGMAFGSTFGAVLAPWIGWRGLFTAVATAGAVVLAVLFPLRGGLGEPTGGPKPSLDMLMRAFASLLGSRRGARTYAFVFLNAVFHSGVFTWLGLFFARRFALGDVGIGLALLGYGLPGFMFGPLIGRAADRVGRRRLIPLGLLLAGGAALALAAPIGLVLATVVVAILSLGYDLTQPLFAGIVTTLDPERPGQAMGLNVFALFTGFAVGSAAFAAVMRGGVERALTIFGVVQLGLGLLAFVAFSSERSGAASRRGT
jgi:predicted MFS family arabinose efflux permease